MVLPCKSSLKETSEELALNQMMYHSHTHTQTIMEQLEELDGRVFREYIQRKSEYLVGIIEPGMHAGLFDWEQCGEPEGVRGYMKEVMFNLVQVHAEVKQPRALYSYCYLPFRHVVEFVITSYFVSPGVCGVLSDS